MSITENLKKISEQEWAQDPHNLQVINEWNNKLNRIAELREYGQLTETKRIVSDLTARIGAIDDEVRELAYIDDKDAINAKLSLRIAIKGLLKQYFNEKELGEELSSLESEVEAEIIKNQL